MTNPTILRANLIGLEGEGIKAIAETARIKDRNRLEAFVTRIYELGGKLIDDMKGFHDTSASTPGGDGSDLGPRIGAPRPRSARAAATDRHPG